MGRKALETGILLSLFGIAVLGVGFSTFIYGEQKGTTINDIAIGDIHVIQDSSRYLLPLTDEEGMVAVGFSLDAITSSGLEENYFSIAIPVTFSSSYWRLSSPPNFSLRLNGFGDTSLSNLALLCGVEEISDAYSSFGISLSPYAFMKTSLDGVIGSPLTFEGFQASDNDSSHFFPKELTYSLEDVNHFASYQEFDKIYLNLFFLRNGNVPAQANHIVNWVNSLLNPETNAIFDLSISDVTGG